jgi:hypothetical protein
MKGSGGMGVLTVRENKYILMALFMKVIPNFHYYYFFIINIIIIIINIIIMISILILLL